MTATNQRGNVVIAGDEICAGIDMDDAKETGPLACAFVVQFDSIEAMRAAIQRGSAEFDFMREES